MVRKHDRQKIVVALVSGMLRVARTARGRDARGGGGAMMAVGDVQRGHDIERRGETRDPVRIANRPRGYAARPRRR